MSKTVTYLNIVRGNAKNAVNVPVTVFHVSGIYDEDQNLPFQTRLDSDWR
jgi:delta-aminolevulinic acid dehydratase/porphobilinogen synthase